MFSRSLTLSAVLRAINRQTDFIDLDNFRGINKTLGHVVGDSVLRICPRRSARRCWTR